MYLTVKRFQKNLVKPTSKSVSGAIKDPIRPSMDTNPHKDWRNSVGNISVV